MITRQKTRKRTTTTGRGLPVTRGDATALDSASLNTAVSQDSRRKKLILIVDDEPRIRKILELKLRLSGYAIILATCGKEALELIHTRKPDIMLLDILMPDMNGFKVLEVVRRFSALPVIAITARTENIEKAIALGANDAMAKPFNPDRVLEKIENVLSLN